MLSSPFSGGLPAFATGLESVTADPPEQGPKRKGNIPEEINKVADRDDILCMPIHLSWGLTPLPNETSIL